MPSADWLGLAWFLALPVVAGELLVVWRQRLRHEPAVGSWASRLARAGGVGLLVLGLWFGGLLLFSRSARTPGAAARSGLSVSQPEPALPAPGSVRPVEEPPRVLLPPEPEVTAGLLLANDYVHTEWTSAGGGLQRLSLCGGRHSSADAAGTDGLVLLREWQPGVCSDVLTGIQYRATAVEGGRREAVRVDDMPYEVESASESQLAFKAAARGRDGWGFLVRKTVTIGEDRGYRVELEITNAGTQAADVVLHLLGPSGIAREVFVPWYLGGHVGTCTQDGDCRIQSTSVRRMLRPQVHEPAGFVWAAVANRYYAVALLPGDSTLIDRAVFLAGRDLQILTEERWRRERLRLGRAGRLGPGVVATPTLALVTVPVTLEPSASHVFRYRVLALPLDRTILRDYGMGLPGLVPLGLLHRLVLGLLRVFSLIVRNYGLSIVIFAAVIAAAFHPLRRWSELRGADARQHNGGDPATAQAQVKARPVWLMRALFAGVLLFHVVVALVLNRVLRIAIELRGQGFLWMQDLGRPDALVMSPVFPPAIPYMLNLMPMLAGVAVYYGLRTMVVTGPRPVPRASAPPRLLGAEPGITEAAARIWALVFTWHFARLLAVAGLVGALVATQYGRASGFHLYIVVSIALAALDRWRIRTRFRAGASR